MFTLKKWLGLRKFVRMSVTKIHTIGCQICFANYVGRKEVLVNLCS
jgi:hypothetical protein